MLRLYRFDIEPGTTRYTESYPIGLFSVDVFRHIVTASFYRAALDAGRSSCEKGVCLSVCQTRDKTEEKSVQTLGAVRSLCSTRS